MEKMNEIEAIRQSLRSYLAWKAAEVEVAQERTGEDYPQYRGPINDDYWSWWDKYIAIPPIEKKPGSVIRKEFQIHLPRLAMNMIKLAKMHLDTDIIRSIEALEEIDKVMMFYYYTGIGSFSVKRARSMLGKLAVQVKIATDPKQRAKNFIKDCWLEGRKDGSLTGRYKASFAKKMLKNPLCATLDSQKKIEDWCREWEKAHPAG